MDQQTMKCGLLMEAAQTHHTMVDAALERLKAHTEGLDAVVREEIRSSLIEELQVLSAESKSAAEALRALGRAANARMAFWSAGSMVLSCVGTTAAIFCAAYWLLPSRAEIATLQAQHDQLAVGVARLEARGGSIDLRRCGVSQRWCVRVSRMAPAFGPGGDYLVLAGE